MAIETEVEMEANAWQAKAALAMSTEVKDIAALKKRDYNSVEGMKPGWMERYHTKALLCRKGRRRSSVCGLPGRHSYQL